MPDPSATPTARVVDAPAGSIEDLARALYGLSALRRDLQRCAGIEHAVAGLAMLGAVRRIGPARISDVAQEMHVSLSVASRQIQALQDEGYVDRVADRHDRRSSLVAISPEGDAKLGRAHDRLTGTVAAATADWSDGEIAGLADGLVRLRDSLAACEDHAAPGGPTPDHAAPVPAPAGAAPTPTLPAVRTAAGPILTSAGPADARHEEHTR